MVLWFQSLTHYATMSSRARLEITVHIRIRTQGKHFEFFTLLMSPVLYLVLSDEQIW